MRKAVKEILVSSHLLGFSKCWLEGSKNLEGEAGLGLSFGRQDEREVVLMTSKRRIHCHSLLIYLLVILFA